MPKITKKQKARLLTYVALLDTLGKLKYLQECGYGYEFSSVSKEWGFIRIDSKNWKSKVRKFKRTSGDHDYKALFDEHELYIRRISKDVLMLSEIMIDWSMVTDIRLIAISKDYVDLKEIL
jgi:hypothetical protein